MDRPDPTNFSLLTYAWVLGLSVWGGAINFFHKLRSGVARPFNLSEFLGEICTSAFVGLVTFWLAERAGLDRLTSAALIAVSGHMGSRALFRIERALEKRFPLIKDDAP